MVVVGAVLALAGCGTQRPIVDPQTVTDAQVLQKDQQECLALARTDVLRIASDGDTRLVVNPLLGAGTGALSAAVINTNVGAGAAAGAVGGLIAAPLTTAREEQKILDQMTGRCLENRGYLLLNAEDAGLSPSSWCLTLGKVGVLKDDDIVYDCIVRERERIATRKQEFLAKRGGAGP